MLTPRTPSSVADMTVAELLTFPDGPRLLRDYGLPLDDPHLARASLRDACERCGVDRDVLVFLTWAMVHGAKAAPALRAAVDLPSAAGPLAPRAS